MSPTAGLQTGSLLEWQTRIELAAAAAPPCFGDGGLNWKGLLRLADRRFPDYRT
jgi:hypothetical protein